MLPIVYVRERCTCPPPLGPRRPRRYLDIRWYRETITHRQLAHGRPREGEGEAKGERRPVRKRESGVGSSSSELYRVTLEWIRQRILVGGEGLEEGEGGREERVREK